MTDATIGRVADSSVPGARLTAAERQLIGLPPHIPSQLAVCGRLGTTRWGIAGTAIEHGHQVAAQCRRVRAAHSPGAWPADAPAGVTHRSHCPGRGQGEREMTGNLWRVAFGAFLIGTAAAGIVAFIAAAGGPGPSEPGPSTEPPPVVTPQLGDEERTDWEYDPRLEKKS